MLPATGYRGNFTGALYSRGDNNVSYWSSTEDSTNSDYAWYLLYTSNYTDTYAYYRSFGLSVRCIEEDATQSDSVWYKDSDGDGYSDGGKPECVYQTRR